MPPASSRCCATRSARARASSPTAAARRVGEKALATFRDVPEIAARLREAAGRLAPRDAARAASEELLD
jgi:hypothetical protein